jgi:predicted NAD-dependent protein-ADP-ribosyltransferase YbiA (DUF1768 family)
MKHEPITSFSGEFEFLSNFSKLENPINFGHIDFFHLENAYVAGKTMNLELRKEIAEMTPGQAKRKGKKILDEGIDVNPKWNDEFRISFMKTLVDLKFRNNPHLASKLIATGTRTIEEGNTHHDNFFGICRCGNCPPDKIVVFGPKNHLGKIQMIQREVLFSEKIRDFNTAIKHIEVDGEDGMKRAIKLIGTDAALAVFMASFRFRKSGSLVSFPSDPLIDEEV